MRASRCRRVQLWFLAVILGGIFPGKALLPGTEPFQEAGVWGGGGGASPPSFRWWPQWGQ